MTKKNKKHKYKGWDCMELAPMLGCVDEIDKDPVNDTEIVREFLRNKYWGSNNRPYIAKECRRYVKALAKQCEEICYTGPLWRGLVAIEDDDTFIQAFDLLLPTAWS